MTLPSSLLFLDYFETPWDQESSRPGVEDILSKIGASPKISLIVMTRIKELPSNLSWTYEAEIVPLSPEAARQTYLAIDSSRGGTVIVWRPSKNYSKIWIIFLWWFACSRLLAGVFRLHIFWGNGGKGIPNLWSWERTSRVASLSPSPSHYHNWRSPITQKHSTFLVYYPYFQMDCRVGWIAYRSWIHQSPPLGLCTLADIAMFSTGRNIEGSITNLALYSFT